MMPIHLAVHMLFCTASPVVFLQVTRCLAGLAAHTATWATFVLNERGEVLTTVITTSERLDALEPVASGLVGRYHAGKERPVVLYTDQDCCVADTAKSRLQQLFDAWRDIVIRLDAWHFMRQFALGVTSDSHPYVSRLAACLFEWDEGDVRLLERAKRQELESSGVQAPKDRAVRLAVTKDEPVRHCRRRTVYWGIRARRLLRSYCAQLRKISARSAQQFGGHFRKKLMGLHHPPPLHGRVLN